MEVQGPAVDKILPGFWAEDYSLGDLGFKLWQAMIASFAWVGILKVVTLMRRYKDVVETKELQWINGTMRDSKCKYRTILNDIEANFIKKKMGDEMN